MLQLYNRMTTVSTFCSNHSNAVVFEIVIQRSRKKEKLLTMQLQLSAQITAHQCNGVRNCMMVQYTERRYPKDPKDGLVSSAPF